MPRPIIEVRNLSKVYQLGAIGATRLKDEVSRFWQWARGNDASPDSGEFWALTDVSFDLQAGEVLGIIGSNGAGKSTLLKILSRITEQTAGEIVLRGRVASLLEVGTGFHPDLTGRENIFLNGAILGMKKAEIRRKLDDIVAFAEVEQFIDTPVKRYSSGMYVRLAFSIAAHLDPEVLIVDEVLAVGDVAFQKKCLGKMGEVAKNEGRTVLFVSHNMGALRSLCSRAILLEHGRTIADSGVDEVVRTYLEREVGAPASFAWSAETAPQQGGFVFRKVSILNERGEAAATLSHDQPFSICIEYQAQRSIPGLRVGFLIQNSEGTQICGSNDFHAMESADRQAGILESRCQFPSYCLNEGQYQLRFGADAPSGEVNLLTPFCLSFSIEDIERHADSRMRLPGVLRPRLHWEVVSAQRGALST